MNPLAIVLVGGEGTRLRPLTYDLPKPMLPVVGRPIVARIIEWLSLHRIDRAVLSLGYRPDAFVSGFPDDTWAGVHLSYAVEPEPLDTAGAIRFAADFAKALNQTVVVVNGDVLTDLDLTQLIAFHQSRDAEATVALTPVENPSAFGVVATDADGRVSAFIEKPPRETAPTNEINAGTYVLEKELLARIAPEGRVSIERAIFPALVEDATLFAVSSDAYWIDTGSPETYLAAQLDIVSGHRPNVILPSHSEPRPGLFVEPDVIMEGETRAVVYLGRGTHIEKGAIVENCVIGEGCVVGPGAQVRSSLLLPGARLGSGAICEGSILGTEASLGANAEVRSMSVIGAHGVVPDGASLDSARLPV